jgi:hypothetical protein
MTPHMGNGVAIGITIIRCASSAWQVSAGRG